MEVMGKMEALQLAAFPARLPVTKFRMENERRLSG